MKNTITTLLILIGFIFSQDCAEPIDVWFKFSNDSKTYGEVIQLDMSKGYAGTDGHFIYLYVTDLNSPEEGIVIAFPIGYWESGSKNSFEEELEKEFKDLEDYLKRNAGKGIKIEKKQ